MRGCSYGKHGAAQCKDDSLKYFQMVTHAAHHYRGLHLPTTNLSFRWYDTFRMSVSAAFADWEYDRACTLFNVAASLSYMATSQDRGDPEGMKAACNYFQQSAGTISAMREIVKDAAWVDRTPDTTSEFLEALEALLLAQAQKCFFEKASAAAMKPVLIGKIAAECAALYEDAHARLATPMLRHHCAQEWLDVVEWNRKAFDGYQHYFAALVHAENHEYGAQVSRLTYATNRCAEAVTLCQKADKMLQEQFKRAHALAKEAYLKAKKDNDLVYNEKVPPVEVLPKLERKAMVKPIRLPETYVPPPEEPPMQPPPPPQGLDSLPPPPPFEAVERTGVSELVAMGFTAEAAGKALENAKGDVEKAAELLLG